MMPTMPPFPSQKQNRTMRTDEHGFTLIEMLVVLAIMSLAAILFVGASGSSNGASSRAAIAKLENKIVSARQRAITSGEIQVLNFEELQFMPQIASNGAELKFYADGSSNGGELQSNGTVLLSVRWLDGQIMK